jgi:hypothetical protein
MLSLRLIENDELESGLTFLGVSSNSWTSGGCGYQVLVVVLLRPRDFVFVLDFDAPFHSIYRTCTASLEANVILTTMTND